MLFYSVFPGVCCSHIITNRNIVCGHCVALFQPTFSTSEKVKFDFCEDLLLLLGLHLRDVGITVISLRAISFLMYAILFIPKKSELSPKLPPFMGQNLRK